MNVLTPEDRRILAAAVALSERGRGRTAPNPNVGCVIMRDGIVLARGWTQPGGRPHAEAMALAAAAAAGDIGGATLYATLEPCAHDSARGPACAALIAAARPARVVVGLRDPDPRTDGRGSARLRAAGIEVVEAASPEAEAAMAGFLTRRRLGRPHVTLKLATSLDGRIAMASGASRWITGAAARAHAHVERARADAILVGRGTWEADRPALDVRLAGLEGRGPRRILLSATAGLGGTGSPPLQGRGRGWGLSPSTALAGTPHLNPSPEGEGLSRWEVIDSPDAIATLSDVDHLLIEGGAATAASFLRADLVDRLLLYRAPVLIGPGRPAIDDIGLGTLADAHGRWHLTDTRMLGSDRMEDYERRRS